MIRLNAGDLVPGDTLLVALEGNPSTGFDWALVGSVAPVLDLAERTFGPSGTALGAPGTVTYRFRAAAQGSTNRPRRPVLSRSVSSALAPHR